MRYGKHTLDSSYVQRSILPRLCRHTKRDGECLIWTSAVDRYGYAKLAGFTRNGGRITIKVHRLVAILFYGHPEGEFDVDHLCNNRRCVLAGHLEIVSSAENTRRMNQRRRDAGQEGLPWHEPAPGPR